MSTTKITVNEAYYLVRIGSWSEEDLERWIQKRISDKIDEVTTEYYDRILEKEANKRDQERYGYLDNYGDFRGKWY